MDYCTNKKTNNQAKAWYIPSYFNLLLLIFIREEKSVVIKV